MKTKYTRKGFQNSQNKIEKKEIVETVCETLNEKLYQGL